MKRGSRKVFTYGEKRRIVAEASEKGIASTAKRHQVKPEVLGRWHGEYRTGLWDGIPDEFSKSRLIKRQNKMRSAPPRPGKNANLTQFTQRESINLKRACRLSCC